MVDPGKKERIVVTSLNNQPRLIKVLAAGGFQSNGSKSGRVKHTSGSEIDFDSITMVLQPNQETYAYTFLVKNSISGQGFTNLILQEVSNGFWGYYLDYETDQHQSFDSNLQNYTGKISRYDLDKKLLWSQEYVNGAVKSDNGRVSPCIEFKIECVEWTVKIDHPTLTFTLTEPCVQSALVMSVNSACALTETVAPGGGINYQLGNGTFIPTQYFSDGSIPGAPTGNQQGASPCQAADSGTGITSGSEANQCNFDIAVVPPAYIPSIEERLSAALALNPYLLLDIPCDQLPKWQALAQHTPPQSVIDKLKNLDDNYTSITSGDWDIQYIENASSPIVNMDYFPVTISKLPKDPATGLQFTPDGFFNHVRKNLNSFFEGNDTEFGPYNSTEATTWNSINYLGTIMRFDILLRVGGVIIGQQDGSVICSFQNDNTWRFTTIESPRDWSHPVSGTREFGLTTNENGTYTFYTRGVDRVAESTDDFMGGLPLIQSAYDGGDALWTKFQENLESYIEQPQNAGLAIIQTPVISRPNWEKVKAVLRRERPISDIGCN